MRATTRIAAGLAVSALTLFLFFRSLDLRKVGESLSNASLPLLFVSILLGYFGHLGMRARRWGTMLAPLKRDVAFYDLFSTTAIGYAVSSLLPGRLGEIVRPVLLARREEIPVPGVLATAVMERVLDVVTIVALAAGAAVAAPFWWYPGGVSVTVTIPGIGPADLVRTIPWLGALGLAGCALWLLLLRVLVLPDSRFLRFLDRRRAATGRVAKVCGVLRQLADGAFFLRSPRRALQICFESVLLWLVVSVSSWIGLVAARVWIPFPGTFLLVLLSAIGISVPTPGGAGPVHFAFQRGLIDLFGVEANLASAATVLYHPVTIYIPPILFGLIFAWRDGLDRAGLRALACPAVPGKR